jgi:hypothetical protein
MRESTATRGAWGRQPLTGAHENISVRLASARWMTLG